MEVLKEECHQSVGTQEDEDWLCNNGLAVWVSGRFFENAGVMCLTKKGSDFYDVLKKI